MLHIIVGSRYDRIGFHRYTLLGRSIGRLLIRKDIVLNVSDSNTRGLPEIYNDALAKLADSDMVVFVHDDIWIDDWYLHERLQDALARFDVVGVAGNRRRLPRQAMWAFVDMNYTWDSSDNLSGAIIHLNGPSEQAIRYGPVPNSVKLLDGAFIAAKVQSLRQKNVTFDPTFAYHFYDLDFCRSCEAAGLKMGTWPIALTHQSPGRFTSPEWTQALGAYLQKWKE